MSRHEIPALRPEQHKVIVGWDQPLMSYFAQVIDRKKEEEDEDDKLVLWVGASLPRLYEIDDLQRALRGYAHLSQKIRTTLYGDKDDGL